MRHEDKSYTFYTEKLRGGEPFSLSRWGDGEWNSLLGLCPEQEANADGHRYFPAMGRQLAEVLKDSPSYCVGMQRLSMRLMGDRIEEWLTQNGVGLCWHDADAFHKASNQGEIDRVFDAFRKAGNLIVVGPEHLRKLDQYVDYQQFVEVPARNCFLHIEDIQDRILKAYASAGKPAVISISAGMPANLFVHHLFPRIGHDAFLLDMGSVWDPYCGVCSRSGHHKLDIKPSRKPARQTSIRRVAVIFDNQQRPDTTGTHCLRALEGMVDVRHFLPSQLAEIPPGEFDLCLCIDDGLRYEIPDRLRPRAWWAIDTHLDFAWYRDRAPQFDFVFTAQRDGAARLQEEGVADAVWLPLACDPDIHRKHDVAKEHDVCFVGNLVPGKRTELLDLIRQHHSGTFVGQRYGQEMAKTLSASRIVFNRSVKNDVNMRVFEALACGSLLLTNDLAENGQAELFQDGVHLATYTDAAELLDKLTYYLEHEEVREKIAATGREVVIAEHTYAHRMRQILQTIGETARVPSREPVAVPRKDCSYYGFARPELLAMIPESAARVLDVGCGVGRLGLSIKARQQAEVVGIELDETAAEAARTRLDEVVAADVEALPETQFDAQFDCIVCGDVLEHLQNPLAFLQKARHWLALGGHLVASIPNVRHHSVVSSLLDGNWTYEPAGLLDETHLRFFTRRDMAELFRSADFEISKTEVVPGPGHQQWEHQGRPGDVALGRLSITGLSSDEAEEFFVYQYLVDARPRFTGSEDTPRFVCSG